MKRLVICLWIAFMLVSCGGGNLNESQVKKIVDQCISEMNSNTRHFEKQYALDQISPIQLRNEMESFVKADFHSLKKDSNGEYTVPSYKHYLVLIFRKNMDGNWVFSEINGMELFSDECKNLSLN